MVHNFFVIILQIYFLKEVMQNIVHVVGLSAMGETSQKVDNLSDKVINTLP